RLPARISVGDAGSGERRRHCLVSVDRGAHPTGKAEDGGVDLVDRESRSLTDVAELLDRLNRRARPLREGVEPVAERSGLLGTAARTLDDFGASPKRAQGDRRLLEVLDHAIGLLEVGALDIEPELGNQLPDRHRFILSNARALASSWRSSARFASQRSLMQ